MSERAGLVAAAVALLASSLAPQVSGWAAQTQILPPPLGLIPAPPRPGGDAGRGATVCLSGIGSSSYATSSGRQRWGWTGHHDDWAAASSASLPLMAKKNRSSGTKRQRQPPGRLTSSTAYLQVEPDGSDAWRCDDEVKSALLDGGGVGVLPTETGYGFVTPLSSKKGVERILRIKGAETCRKPLSLLCADLATVDRYCLGIDRATFKLLKTYLPGPYTFVLPASSAVPKGVVFDDRGQMRVSWVRRTIGVRMPSDPVLRYVQDELLDGMPMLVSSLPTTDDDDDDDDEERGAFGGRSGTQMVSCPLLDSEDGREGSWCNEVDVVVDAGDRPSDGSTVYDLSGGPHSEPVLLRAGLGDLIWTRIV